MKSFLLLFVTFMVAASVTIAQVKVSGTVLENGTRKIIKSTVTVIAEDFSKVVYNFGELEKFNVNLAPGSYQIIVSSPGYSTTFILKDLTFRKSLSLGRIFLKKNK